MAEKPSGEKPSGEKQERPHEEDEENQAPAPPPPATVHPAALYVAGLFKPMSYPDQQWSTKLAMRLIQGAGVVGYVAGWWLESFTITAYTVLLAAAVSFVMCVPNWRQRSYAEEGDAGEQAALRWVPKDVVDGYYARLNAAEQAAAGAGGKATTH